MTPITILGVVMLSLAAVTLMKAFGSDADTGLLRRLNTIVLQLGIFTFFVGILSQAIGLMQAFRAIQEIGDVSPALVAGGLYVSMIAPVYGLIVLLVSIACWSVARYKID